MKNDETLKPGNLLLIVCSHGSAYGREWQHLLALQPAGILPLYIIIMTFIANIDNTIYPR